MSTFSVPIGLAAMELTQQILKYWGESEDLDDLAIAVPVDDLFTAIVELLQSSDAEILSQALFFAKDMISWQTSEARNTVRAAYPESIVVKAIEALLWSAHHRIRKQAGYTLGKTCSYSSVPAMIEAFHQWRDRDPLMLPFFIGELAWLGAENFHDLVGEMISSPCFTTRWAAVDCLSRFGGPRRQQQQRWDYLRLDRHELVRQEAAYEYRVYLFRVRGGKEFYSEPSFEVTTERQAIDQKYQPAVFFSNVKVQFTNYLHELGQTDYTIGQLETFIENYVAELIVPSPLNP
jgi:hypothetical protein